MKIAKVGDLISWSFDNADTMPEFLKGTKHQAKVAIVFPDYYGVYAEYGQDLIDFEDVEKVQIAPTLLE